MKVTRTPLDGLLILEPTVFGDERGFFMESYNARKFSDAVGRSYDFVQDNHSRSSKGVLRGLHYQLDPHAQGKLVRVVRGSVFDVAVDIRKGSATFGGWFGIELNEHEHKQLWIPPGFAHGFMVTSDSADFIYKTTEFYFPAAEATIRWDDPALAIDWPLNGVPPVLSGKDAAGSLLRDAVMPEMGAT
jgi:dTDP-4-dehydrorhamnose 3,5-epimerase